MLCVLSVRIMSNIIAERRLLFAPIGGTAKNEIVVQIHQPYLVTADMVSFAVDNDTAACEVVIMGLPEDFREITYGADLLQALQLAADIEPILRRLSKKYNFYSKSGEPYFE